MSKFLLLGRSLDQVIACVTINAARVFEVFNDPGKRHQTVVWRMSWAQQTPNGSFRCGRRAKKDLRIVSYWNSFVHVGRWFWRLPGSETRTPARDTYAAWRLPGTPMRVLPRAVV